MAHVETLQGLTYAIVTQDINAATMERNAKVKRKVASDVSIDQIVAAIVGENCQNSEIEFTGMTAIDPECNCI